MLRSIQLCARRLSLFDSQHTLVAREQAELAEQRQQRHTSVTRKETATPSGEGEEEKEEDNGRKSNSRARQPRLASSPDAPARVAPERIEIASLARSPAGRPLALTTDKLADWCESPNNSTMA